VFTGNITVQQMTHNFLLPFHSERVPVAEVQRVFVENFEFIVLPFAFDARWWGNLV